MDMQDNVMNTADIAKTADTDNNSADERIFTEVEFDELSFSPHHLASNDWFLITAGDEEGGYNTMTASWGLFGSLWGRHNGMPVAQVFVRPQRYTKEFMDSNELFTLSFFGPDYKRALTHLGTVSGRDEDKITATQLTPICAEGYTYFKEASMVLVCRKLYRQTIDQNCFIDESIVDKMYPKRDFHDIYVGEIVTTLICESDEYTEPVEDEFEQN